MKIDPPLYIKDNKDIILDILAGIGVESFEVNFDGNGDDGQIYEPSEVLPKKAAKKFEEMMEEKVKGARVCNGTRFNTDGSSETIWDTDVSLKGLIEGLCYDVLESSWGGWEINEGSHGTFTFDVKKRKVHLGFNAREVISHLTENTF